MYRLVYKNNGESYSDKKYYPYEVAEYFIVFGYELPKGVIFQEIK